MNQMESQFESLPEQQEAHHIQMQETFSATDCQSEKKTTLRWLWGNLQKIVSILVIVYLLMLIINIIAVKDPFFSVWFTNGQKDSIGRLNNQKSNHLEAIQTILTQQDGKVPLLNTLTQGESNQIVEEHVQHVSSLSTADKANKKGIHQIKDKPRVQSNAEKATQTELNDPNGSNQPVLSRNLFENYRILVKQVQQQKNNRLTVSKYQRFNHIYQDNGINFHKTIHSLSKEERQSIVSRYFTQKQHKNLYYADLLKQNYELNRQRSKSDSLHLELLNQQYDLAKDEQTFMCVVVNTHKNAFNDQINFTLNSIFSQQYSDYEVIIADAASSDATPKIVTDYLARNNKSKEQARVLQFQTESTAFNAIVAAKECREGSLVLFLDGNTELLGKEVFNLIDSEYRSSTAVVLYSSYYALDVSSGTLSHFSAKSYDESERFMPLYRNIPKKYGKIMASRYTTIQNIPTQYTQSNGKPFEYSGMDAVAASLLELSCGKIRAISQPLGLVIYDSSIEKEEQSMRIHEQMLISSKKKFDLC